MPLENELFFFLPVHTVTMQQHEVLHLRLLKFTVVLSPKVKDLTNINAMVETFRDPKAN